MKAAGLTDLKKALAGCSDKERSEVTMRLARFKKENKELLTYLLFYNDDEPGFVSDVKAEVQSQFADLNTSSGYYFAKGVRKILRQIKKYIRYSGKKETEVDLLMFFCAQLHQNKRLLSRSTALKNLLSRQLQLIHKSMEKLHEDLQYDYKKELEMLDLNP